LKAKYMPTFAPLPTPVAPDVRTIRFISNGSSQFKFSLRSGTAADAQMWSSWLNVATTLPAVAAALQRFSNGITINLTDNRSLTALGRFDVERRLSDGRPAARGFGTIAGTLSLNIDRIERAARLAGGNPSGAQAATILAHEILHAAWGSHSWVTSQTPPSYNAVDVPLRISSTRS